MIEEIDQDENVNLVKSSKQGEAHETVKHRMESDVDFSNASPQNDDDELTLAKTLVNIKRSVVKDKGKAIMQEFEPPKKIKKREMIQIGHDEELAQKLHTEELAKKEVASKSSQAHDIDWSDPAVIRYHTLQNRSFSIAEVRKNMCMYLRNQGGYKLSHFKGMKHEDIRPIFERVWDQNHAFVPKDSEIEKEVMKRSGFIQKQSTKEEKEKKKDEESSKQVEEETVQKEDVIPEQVMNESSRKAEGRLKRNALKARKDKDKRQKKQDDLEKLMYQMLNDFHREDLIVLYRLFNEKCASTRPGFDDIMLWGDMKVMFEPDSNDTVWKNHNSQQLIEWKLYDSCEVHSLMLGEGASYTQGTIPSIPIGSSISPKGFLLLVLLLVVIIVTVVVVIVILIVVVDVVSLILKLSFEIIGISLVLVFLLGFSMAAACASRAMLTSFWESFYQHKTTDDKNDITSFERVYGGNNSSRTKKYRGSNSSEGGNSEDRVKLVGGVIGSGDGIEFSEELKELLSDEAEK
ncbi:hypothetical protein Tco_1301446 [Tanacetum coccineum]